MNLLLLPLSIAIKTCIILFNPCIVAEEIIHKILSNTIFFKIILAKTSVLLNHFKTNKTVDFKNTRSRRLL